VDPYGRPPGSNQPGLPTTAPGVSGALGVPGALPVGYDQRVAHPVPDSHRMYGGQPPASTYQPVQLEPPTPAHASVSELLLLDEWGDWPVC